MKPGAGIWGLHVSPLYQTKAQAPTPEVEYYLYIPAMNNLQEQGHATWNSLLYQTQVQYMIPCPALCSRPGKVIVL